MEKFHKDFLLTLCSCFEKLLLDSVNLPSQKRYTGCFTCRTQLSSSEFTTFSVQCINRPDLIEQGLKFDILENKIPYQIIPNRLLSKRSCLISMLFSSIRIFFPDKPVTRTSTVGFVQRTILRNLIILIRIISKSSVLNVLMLRYFNSIPNHVLLQKRFRH